MMTGDSYCIGSKYGICFYGKWVWKLKDYIDKSFMNMFDPNLIFKNYQEQGTREPLEADNKQNENEIHFKKQVENMNAETAGKLLSCSEEEEEFHERF